MRTCQFYCLVFLFLGINLSSQEKYEFALPDSLDFLALQSTEDGFLFLVERNGLYELNGGQLECIQNFKKALSRSSIFGNSKGHIIAGAEFGGFYEFTPERNLVYHDLPVNHSILNLDENGDYWLAASYLYGLNEERWKTASRLGKAYKAVTGTEEKPCFFHNNIISRLSEDSKLDTFLILEDNMSIGAACLNDGKLYYTIENKIYKVDIGAKSEPVHETSRLLEIEGPILKLLAMDSHVAIMSSDQIITLDSSLRNSDIPTIDSPEEYEWLDMAYRDDASVWTLNPKSLSIINFDRNIISRYRAEKNIPQWPYTIRGNDYISNGAELRRFNKETGSWIVDKSKAAPRKIITPEDGHPVLIFKDRLIKIHRENALIMDYLRFENTEVLDYAFTKELSYLLQPGVIWAGRNGYSVPYQVDKDFIHLQTLNDEVFITDGKTIHQWDGGNTIAIYTAPNGISDFIALPFGFVILDNSGSLFSYNIKTEETQGLSNPGQDIKKMFANNGKLYFLQGKTLISCPLENLNNISDSDYSRFPLLFYEKDSEVIQVDDSVLWLNNQGLIKKILLDENSEIKGPRIFIELNDDNNSLKVHHTNHWSEDIQFNYFFTGNQGQETVWARSTKQEIPKSDKPYSQLVVQMSDDIFGANSARASIMLPAVNQALNLPLYFLALIIIFASGFSGLRLISK